MALSVALIVGLLALAGFVVWAGSSLDRIELYFLGVIIFLLVGLSVMTGGYSVVSGEFVDRNESEVLASNNLTDTFVVEYRSVLREDVSDVFTDALGLLFVLVAGGLSLTYFQQRKLSRELERRSLDVKDDF